MARKHHERNYPGTIIANLLLNFGFFKKEIAEYLGVSVGSINQLLLNKCDNKILNQQQIYKLNQLYTRMTIKID